MKSYKIKLNKIKCVINSMSTEGYNMEGYNITVTDLKVHPLPRSYLMVEIKIKIVIVMVIVIVIVIVTLVKMVMKIVGLAVTVRAVCSKIQFALPYDIKKSNKTERSKAKKGKN